MFKLALISIVSAVLLGYWRWRQTVQAWCSRPHTARVEHVREERQDGMGATLSASHAFELAFVARHRSEPGAARAEGCIALPARRI